MTAQAKVAAANGRGHGDGRPTFRHLHFTSDPDAVAGAIEAVLTVLGDLPMASEALIRAEITIVETINNIVEHAYLNVPGRPIELIVLQRPDRLICHFIDQGVPMPGGRLPVGCLPPVDLPVADLPEGGFGWALIRSVGGEVSYRRVNDENHLSVDLDLRSIPERDTTC